MDILKTYKHNRKIICYIRKNSNGTFVICTGKPSDSGCLGWAYPTFEDAEKMAGILKYQLLIQ